MSQVVLSPLTEADSGPKGRKIIWNDALYDYCKEIKHVVSAETLLNYLGWKNTFTVRTYTSDKQLGAVIGQNKKSIAFFSRRLINPQRNYTNTRK